MKRMLAAFILLAMLPAEAEAISRHNVTGMDCASIQDIVRREGAAILRYKSARTGATLYDRYVSGRRYCKSDETTQRVYIPAADTRSCPVRNCMHVDVDDDFPLFVPFD